MIQSVEVRLVVRDASATAIEPPQHSFVSHDRHREQPKGDRTPPHGDFGRVHRQRREAESDEKQAEPRQRELAVEFCETLQLDEEAVSSPLVFDPRG